MRFTKTELFMVSKNIGFVVLGTLVLAFGVAVFLVPFDLVTGGVSGIAIILHKIIPFELEIDWIIVILSWSFFFLGFLILGKGFSLKTLLSTVVYTSALPVFFKLADASVFDGFFALNGPRYEAYAESAMLLASLFGGVCVGVGCALTFLGGGSTGGVDVLAFTLCKIFKKLKNSVAMFLIDGGTVVLGMFILGDFVLTLLGIISAFIGAVMVDKVFLGGKAAFVAHIISSHYESINEAIIRDMDRTTTIMNVTGGYSKTGKTLLMVSFNMSEYAKLMDIVHKVDKKAFMTIHRAHEISGEGWTIEKPKRKL